MLWSQYLALDKDGQTNRSRANTLAILPTAMILFLMTFRRSTDSSEVIDVGDTSAVSSSLSSSSSLVHVLSTAASISVTATIAGQSCEPYNRGEGQTLLADKGQTPREHVHEVRQPIRMRCAIELPDIHHVAFVF